MKPDMKLREFDLALGFSEEANKIFQEEIQAKKQERDSEAKKETSPTIDWSK